MPTAFVFSAGGMYAAWEVGVWKVLRDHVEPDIIVGASAGAWNAWSIAGGATPDELTRDWLDPRTADTMQTGLHRYGFLRPEGLHAKARELFARYQPRLPFGLTVVEVPRMKLKLVRGREVRWEHLAATCTIPMGFPPVHIDGKNYVDGGLMGALPVWAAEEMGATRAIAINCLTTLPFRMLRYAIPPRKPSPQLEVIRIEPSQPLGSLHDALFWSAGNIERWIALGENDAKLALSSITM